ncbi:MAG: hypothetical protein AUJ12_09975 [Alphaproteobacteria bacterium CG1_02_46_17]|nr:MAG: hypothetical protein AUJ12_09975 [Alphaproteobacteria bacterium CG1_02_46_17]
MANRNIVESWGFHVAVRLIALLVMVGSVIVIISHGSEPSQEDSFNTSSLDHRQIQIDQNQEEDLAQDFSDNPPARLTLSEMQARQKEISQKEANGLEPANGKEDKDPPADEWPIEEKTLDVDGVLVPAKETVISSSHDGKISDIPLQNGDLFKKNDILVRYACDDLAAEAEMAGVEKNLTDTKVKTGDQLFKLDIISDVDRLNIESEDKAADAKIKLYEARLEDCTIRAGFDGRVTKRLANEGEYTRTDRVLLEVASNDPLHIEFLMPSKWLRWVNVGAPITISLNETGRTYSAKVTRIYGEVDPVSRSIQVRAVLDSYHDPLLSGMSGKVELDAGAIKDAGVIGYLSQQAPYKESR